jgi:proteasome beta subunit
LGPAGFSGPYLAPGSSFLDFARAAAPHVLPGYAGAPDAARLTAIPPTGGAPGGSGPTSQPLQATTICALTFRGGLVMAGDRRATQGLSIASSEMEKVYPADQWSAIGVAGSAGIALQLVRLLQLELEHYEKIEGTGLSLEGKANRLGTLIRANLGLAFKGLGALPLLGGWDQATAEPRIFSYDVTGGHYEEHHFHAIGSGAVFAKGSLKKLYKPGQTERAAVKTALTALTDAAEDDAGTGGVDQVKAIFPVVAVVDRAGYRRLADTHLAALMEAKR